MSHTPAPVQESPSASPRGRCAVCTKPILADQESHHVPVATGYRYPTDLSVSPRPYQHKDCIG